VAAVAVAVAAAIASHAAQGFAFGGESVLPDAKVARAFSSGELAKIDGLVADAIGQRKMPGCVVAIGRRDGLAYCRAFGNRQTEPTPRPMTQDVVFDLASLTKSVATATSVMILVERKAVALDKPVACYLPEFAAQGKDSITVADLLTHQGGLIADNSMGDYRDGAEKAWLRICNSKPAGKPREKFVYSDVGFIVLGKLVERVSGKPLDQFAREEIFEPLGMRKTGYRPEASLRAVAAPTEKREGRWIQGEVHDPRAYALGGVAGHAGVFSTADDLAIFAQTLLNGGCRGDRRILSAETIHRMTAPRTVPGGGVRALGWDMRTGYSSNRGKCFSARAFGHGGFTGTALWIDPGLDLYVVFLSNRVHPNGKGSVNALAGEIGTIAGNALRIRSSSSAASSSAASSSAASSSAASSSAASSSAAPSSVASPSGVLAGIDVLQRDGFRSLAGRRVGLITNHTGVNRQGVGDATLLSKAPGVTLVALFSPEHGFRGNQDRENLQDTRDEATGAVVHSLYGKTRRPTAEMLRGVDTLVFDIQDVGVRFYTYISTMGLAMQAAAEHKIRFVVLDRPNPLGGCVVAGPMLDPGRESFVGFHRLPVRHGMTVGEIACLLNDELGLKLDLEVIRVEGWRRADDFDAAGLRWNAPSPNLRNLTEAFLYPGVGLLEMTNLSVGRGTETPFEVIGSPWIEGERLAKRLNEAGLHGVRFEATEFTPASSKYQNQRCHGVRISLTDRAAFEPVRMGVAIALELRRLYPALWETKSLDVLLCNQATCSAVKEGRPLSEVESLWRADLESFQARRAKHLLYK
jgi:uncharacterized protein YbbC (DUF1343 family)/CubicO group peptidase (beta-lactamase class C family)